MKKKILFIIPNLKSGGAEKSLVTLLQLFDYDKYDVSLFLFREEGLFLNCVPPQVEIFTAGENYELFDGEAKTAIKTFLKKGRLDLTVARVFYANAFKEADSYSRETKMWKQLRKSVSLPTEKFDCVIGYLEGPSDWLAAEFKADKKIGYMHSFLEGTSSDKKHFSQTINKFNFFISVSDESLLNLKKYNPNYKGYRCILNIVSPSLINSMANDKVNMGDGLNLLTVGRLSSEKGIDIAVEACGILKDKNYNFKWYHIGSGSEKKKIFEMIKENDLEGTFVPLGEKSNPYPYFKNCNIYVQPSRNEGWGITITEAKSLCKPIVATNFSTVFEQIEHGVNGLICEMNAQSVADAVERLINDKALREKLSYNLSQEKIGNEEEIQKLYDLIES